MNGGRLTMMAAVLGAAAAMGVVKYQAVSAPNVHPTGNLRAVVTGSQSVDLFWLPGEVDSLVWLDRTSLSWHHEANHASYDVLKGVLGEWPVGTGAQEVCLAGAVAVQGPVADSDPLPGVGTYYLVRARAASGAGSWGDQRTSARCGE